MSELKAFHQRHYHPSNAKFFFYGDDDPEERLRLLGARLAEFSGIEVEVGRSAAAALHRAEAADAHLRGGQRGCGRRRANEAPKETMLTVNWMLDEPADIETALAFDILEHILIGTAAAPLYKALIDSGLGEALAGTGLDDGLRQPMFSIGLKGIDAADADKVERLIIDTISGLAEKGSTPTLEAALNTVEFHLRENNTGAFPRGIVFMLRSLRSWLHGRDPLSPLAFEAPLAAIKAKVAAGERYFENLIRRQFIDSQHRTVMILGRIRIRPSARRRRKRRGSPRCAPR